MAYSGDHDEFQRMTDPYHRELLVHCYRILGSFEDAEDALQEALLRAWRRLESLKEVTSLRAWLYRIATNVSLDMLDYRKARSLPNVTHSPAQVGDPLPPAVSDPLWLDPLPDTYIDGQSLTPEARYEIHESISLAFLMALQKLPGRQRAILILRDVMGWHAQEVADLLDLSVMAVNSALQRARATMKNYHQTQQWRLVSADDDQQVSELLARYMAAWEKTDSVELVALLREDALLTMPPIPAWFMGRAAVQTFVQTFLFASPATYRLRPVRANGCPAFAVYQRDAAGVYRPAALHILTIKADCIARIDDFLTFDGRLFERFDLPFSS
ncbi:MAG: RNA polymerase subunit sigma-70 [Anaerolineae bacterium]